MIYLSRELRVRDIIKKMNEIKFRRPKELHQLVSMMIKNICLDAIKLIDVRYAFN